MQSGARLTSLVALLAVLLVPLAFIAGREIGVRRGGDAAPAPVGIVDTESLVTDDDTEIIRSVPVVIERPGRYALEHDLELASPAAVAIRVAASPVTIDLHGHAIRCTSTVTERTAFGIGAEQQSGLVVRNGTIEGFYAGVFIRDAANDGHYAPRFGQHRIERLIVRKSTFIGIRVEGRACVIAGNRVIDTGGATTHPNAFAFGIESIGPAATIRGNTVASTMSMGEGEALGISVSESGMASLVVDNNVYNDRQAASRSIGIWIGGGSSASIENNQVTNFDWGIAGSSPTYWIYRDNRLVGCEVPVFLPYGDPAHEDDPPPVLRDRWQDGGGNVVVPFTTWPPEP